MSRLFYGDNLEVLRQHIDDESIDLIYLDPPFNSKTNYNVFFRSPEGVAAESQIEAFEDSWHYGPAAAQALHEAASSGNVNLARLLDAIQSCLGQNGLMAYLAMMAVRLLELHRVLKPTGSLYLHCDPSASHYLKLLLDAIFGLSRFRSEISWRRAFAHNDAKQGRAQYGNVRDIILFYSKSARWTWNWQYTAYDERYLDTAYRHTEPSGRRFRRGDLTAARPGGEVSYPWPVKRPAGGGWQADLEREHEQPQPGWEYKQVLPYRGRYWAFSQANMAAFARSGRLAYAKSGMPEYKRYLDEQPGIPLQNDWGDLPPVAGQERRGYPTQKPLALLERIIAASSNPGDVILDPFCGCGTAVHAAQRLGRRWIGIDITYLAIGEIERRLRSAFPGIALEVIGAPKDLADAKHLAASSPYQFQYWITQQIGGRPHRNAKKGADRGIDGHIFYNRSLPGTGRPMVGAALISVKAGRNIGVGMVRDLRGVMERERADLGVFVCVALPTREMEREAAAAGIWTDPTTGIGYPRLQLFTLTDFFAGQLPRVPFLDRSAGYRRTQAEPTLAEQARLL